MKEFIESIIEIILENASCEHTEKDQYCVGGTMGHVEYSLNDEKAVIEKCMKALPARLIERPEITEEFIEKKAREMHQENYGSIMNCDYKCNAMERFRKLIRSFFKEES